MDGGFVKGEGGGGRGGDGQRGKAVAVVNSSFVHQLTKGNAIYLHRQKFSSVTMVGIIENYSETSVKVEFNLRDGEGPSIKVQKWKTNQNNEGDVMQTELPHNDGALVRVYGTARTTANNPLPHIIAYQIIPITNLNELTMHHLETVSSSLMLNKRKNNILAGIPPVSGFPNSSSQGGSQGKPLSSNRNQQAVEGPAIVQGMKPNEVLVLKAITACSDVQGIHRDALFRTLQSVGKEAIDKSLEFLLTEGHIYTTTDDYHYKSTDG